MICFAIRRPVAVTMAYLAVALLGWQAWRNIPLELLPDTRLPRLTVRAEWPGASPETTEAFMTSPLEAAVQQVRGVERVESVSSETGGTGQAEIDVEFARGTDMDFARLELTERLAALAEELPAGAGRPRVSPYVPEEFEEQNRPFLSWTVTGPYTLEALRQHIDDVVAPELRQVDGVSDVRASGGRRRVLELEIDENRVRALGLSLEEVRRRIRELEYVQEAGAVEDAGMRLTLSIRERPASTDEIRRAVVLADGKRIVRVDDVASVHDTYEDHRSYYRIDGLPAVSFFVTREIGTSVVAVADAAKARMDSLSARAPAATRFILDRDESREVRKQLTDLGSRALVSAAAVALVLVIFLGSAGATGIVFATICFSILITLNLVYFAGFSLNLLTLMGLAMGFGLVVDNAIVVQENIFRRRRTGEPASEAAERGAREVVLPILAATLTTLVVLIPFVYMQGELRLYYVPLAVVVGFSLVASLGVAFTFIPALAGRALAGGAGEGAAAAPPPRPPIYARFYGALIGFTLRRAWVAPVLAVLLLGGSFLLFDEYVSRGVLWWGLGGQDTYVQVTIRQPRGEELDRTDEIARYFEERIAGHGYVDRYVTTVYPQFASIRVSFPDSVSTTQLPILVYEELAGEAVLFGGASIAVRGYGQSFYGGGGGGAPNYSVRILGYNYQTARDIAEDIASRLTGFARVREVDTNSPSRGFTRDKATEIALRLDRERLAMHGLTARDAVRQVRAATQGRDLPAYVNVGGEELLFSVKYAGYRDLDLHALLETLIPTAGGGVRLADVATAEEREVLSTIVREDQQYQRNVSWEFRGPSKLGDLVRDAVVEATRLPPGYSIETTSLWEWSEEERQQIYGVLAVAVLLVFMATAALFESLRQPLCVLLTVPMALIGVFLVFFYTGASFTREAYVGVIMMSGIVVNNAILLVDHVNQVRRRRGLALEEAIRTATIERVRPILMTSATTIFGLLPLVVRSESADANIWNALGYALIGGLSSSTILVLTVTPSLYLLLGRRAERRRLERAAAERHATAPVPVSA